MLSEMMKLRKRSNNKISDIIKKKLIQVASKEKEEHLLKKQRE